MSKGPLTPIDLLIIEDDPNDIRLVQDILSGYRMSTA